MKARVKATGEIVDVNPTIIDGYDFVDKEGVCYTIRQLELVRESKKNDPDYWTRLEHTYAGMAMQAVLSLVGNTASPEYVAEEASNYAHALVEKLKEKEERK